MRLSTYSTPRIISCAELTEEYLALPRGCEDAVVELFKEKGVAFRLDDETNHGRTISVHFAGELRKDQQEAVDALTSNNTGVLSATTAFGKTVAAIGLIARHAVNTLILVHTKALLDQWVQRLEQFLIINEVSEFEEGKRRWKKRLSPIGTLSSTGNKLHGIIDVALMQSCISDNEVKFFVKDYGVVIVDECHHVSATNFEQIVKVVNAQYVYGLTATPIRKDGLQPIIFMQCGPIRFSADAKSQIAKQSFDRYLIPRFTSFRSVSEDKQSMPTIYQSLSEDEVRNNLIVEDVHKAITDGRTPIILTSRTSHVQVLAEKLSLITKNVVVLTGTGTTKEKREELQRLQVISPKEQLVVVATGKYVGEGFDYPRLDTLFLALPISWKGLVAQYAGRLHRENEGKKDVRIYDYIDIHEPVCDSMYRKRLKGYASIGYRIINKETTTLFGDIIGIAPDMKEGKIFNGKTFLTNYTSDLANSKRSILISSPKLYKVERNVVVKLLCELLCRGHEVLILTSQSNEQTEYLLSRGLPVKIKPDLSICTTIIDKSIVWYGAINALGYMSEEDNAIKVTDNNLANDLIEVLLC